MNKKMLNLINYFKVCDKERSINMQAKIYEAKCNNVPIEEREAALKRLGEMYGLGNNQD